MNEQEFILLMEEYLEGSITPQGRFALKTEVLKNPTRRQLFENQARQHVRLHAQSSRIDFSESQRIAVMVMDIADKQKEPNAFMELIRKKTFRERASLILKGLRAAPGTPAHRAAKAELIRIFGPASLSVVVNVAALLLLLFWVPYVLPPPPGDSRADTEGVVINLGDPQADNSKPQADNNPDNSQSDSHPDKGSISAPNIGTAQGPVGPIIPGYDGPPTDIMDIAPPGKPNNDGDLLAMTPKTKGITASLFPGSRGNRDRKDRDRILIEQKATKTEIAVVKALKWLKAKQLPDGSWPGQDTTAMTGLALLTYLAHNEMPTSPQFGDTVTHGLQSLLKNQSKDGAFSQNVYAHAIATYAIAEAYTMTRIMDLKAPLEKAVSVIIKGQQTNGGFDYNYLKGSRFDTSVTGWQIQALKAARTAEPDMDGLEEALARSTRFLLSDAFARDGSGFVYEGKNGVVSASGGKQSMTGVGTLCLQMLGKNTSAPVRAGLKVLQNAELEWVPDGKANVYTSYYVAQAKFQSGNQPEWMRWNLNMQKILLARQDKDGHWEQGDFDNGSHVYTTTLCVLMLEVYYRYLPSDAHPIEQKPAGKIVSGDVLIDVL